MLHAVLSLGTRSTLLAMGAEAVFFFLLDDIISTEHNDATLISRHFPAKHIPSLDSISLFDKSHRYLFILTLYNRAECRRSKHAARCCHHQLLWILALTEVRRRLLLSALLPNLPTGRIPLPVYQEASMLGSVERDEMNRIVIKSTQQNDTLQTAEGWLDPCWGWILKELV